MPIGLLTLLNPLSELRESAKTAGDKVGDKIAALGDDPDAGALLQLQAALTEFSIKSNLSATLMQQFTNIKDKILGKIG